MSRANLPGARSVVLGLAGIGLVVGALSCKESSSKGPIVESKSSGSKPIVGAGKAVESAPVDAGAERLAESVDAGVGSAGGPPDGGSAALSAPVRKGRAKGLGALYAEVKYTGPVPAREPAVKSKDPFCAKFEAGQDAVRVQGGKLLDAVVRVLDGPVSKQMPKGAVEVELARCAFSPRVVVAAKGQRLLFHNHDARRHELRGVALGPGGAKTWFQAVQAASAKSLERVLDKVGMFKVTCGVHPGSSLMVVVAENPHHGVTGADGSVVLEDMPAGTYVVEAWHPVLGMQRQEVKVEAGEVAASAEFELTANEY